MIQTTGCKLQDPQISARGAKSCQLLSDGNSKVFFQLGDEANPVSTPFGATSFNADDRTSRRTIEFNLTPEQEKAFADFDIWATEYLAANSERLIKKKLNIDQGRECYKSPVSKKETYSAHLRCKINVCGTNMVRCWDTAGKRKELPSDLRNFQIIPRINISHLWCMSKEFGWVCQIHDMVICESEETCPIMLT